MESFPNTSYKYLYEVGAKSPNAVPRLTVEFSSTVRHHWSPQPTQ